MLDCTLGRVFFDTSVPGPADLLIFGVETSDGGVISQGHFESQESQKSKESQERTDDEVEI